MATSKKSTNGANGGISIPIIQKIHIPVRVRGISPVVTHPWSEKQKKAIADKQAGKRTVREKKNPEQEYKDAMYLRPDGSFGLPAIAFKKAMVRAAKPINGLDMIDVRGSIFVRPADSVDPELVLMTTKSGPRMREDALPVGKGTDLRYRPEFLDWEAEMVIEMNANDGLLSETEAVALLNRAGFHVGIGENRPEKSGGDWGRFEVMEAE